MSRSVRVRTQRLARSPLPALALLDTGDRTVMPGSDAWVELDAVGTGRDGVNDGARVGVAGPASTEGSVTMPAVTQASPYGSASQRSSKGDLRPEVGA